MNTQREVPISEFKKGDLITRIRPSKPVPGSEDFGEDIRDRNYIGKPLVFLGIANGCIYVERQQKQNEDDTENMFMSLFGSLLDKSGPINLPLDMWDEGWSYYVDPYNIGQTSKSYSSGDIVKLRNDLKQALDNEDYELAEKIKKQIKEAK
jgi:hypothetical protein